MIKLANTQDWAPRKNSISHGLFPHVHSQKPSSPGRDSIEAKPPGLSLPSPAQSRPMEIESQSGPSFSQVASFPDKALLSFKDLRKASSCSALKRTQAGDYGLGPTCCSQHLGCPHSCYSGWHRAQEALRPHGVGTDGVA
jgi:hypothetical protein